MAVTKIDSKKIPVRAPAKKRGRPAGSTTKKPVDWEALAKKLQRALAAEIKRNDELSWQSKFYKDAYCDLRNLSFFDRLFKWPE